MNYTPFLFLFLSSSLFASSSMLNYVFHRSLDTLQTIEQIISRKEKGVYLRFGDGDVLLACGISDYHQKSHQNLQYELREAFALNGPMVLKCFPLHCKKYGGWEPGMFPGNHEWEESECDKYAQAMVKFWNGPVTDIYSMAALALSAYQYPEECYRLLNTLKHSAPIILVGNENIPDEIAQALFGDNHDRVKTPANNAYESIDLIEQETINIAQTIPGYKVIVVCMGCSGRALEKRLWQKLDNVFLFDFGSLMDSLCGWQTRHWMKVSHFDGQDFLEKFREFEACC